MMYSLPAGSFDEKRHGDYAGCARAELSEEVDNTFLNQQMYSLLVWYFTWHLSVK